jgi:phosphatidylglycerophosphate synthase
MDGLRARRLKCGSCLGRVVDEGTDLIAYLNVANLVLWMLRPGPSAWILFIGLANVPFQTMELRFMVTKKLVMIVGELGPVEIEVIFSTIIFLSGLYQGGNLYDISVYDTFSYDFVPRELIWKHIFMGLLAMVYLLEFVENLGGALISNFKQTSKNLVPLFVIISMSMAHSFLPSF